MLLVTLSPGSSNLAGFKSKNEMYASEGYKSQVMAFRGIIYSSDESESLVNSYLQCWLRYIERSGAFGAELMDKNPMDLVDKTSQLEIIYLKVYTKIWLC